MSTLSIKTSTDLEKAVQEQLELMQRRTPSFWHRFYDTKSAGAFLPKQPSDFLLIHNGRSFFIEAKFSEVHESLRQCFSNAVTDDQLAAARMVTRAKGTYVLLFYSGVSKLAELWPGLYCYGRRNISKPLEYPNRIVCESIGLAVNTLITMPSEHQDGKHSDLFRSAPRSEEKSPLHTGVSPETRRHGRKRST